MATCPMSQNCGKANVLLVLGKEPPCASPYPEKSLKFKAVPGDYVMVHVGFAISQVDAAEAERTYKLLEEMGTLESELPPAEL